MTKHTRLIKLFILRAENLMLISILALLGCQESTARHCNQKPESNTIQQDIYIASSNNIIVEGIHYQSFDEAWNAIVKAFPSNGKVTNKKAISLFRDSPNTILFWCESNTPEFIEKKVKSYLRDAGYELMFVASSCN